MHSAKETILKFDELENRIERMEAEADLVNYGRKKSLGEELDRLSVDDEIEKELLALKSTGTQKSKTTSNEKGEKSATEV
jgi:phage shock protein A